MPFTFRPAKRESVHLLLGVSGASGSGKTWSAMVLAKGLAGGKRFAVVDTENRRASMYADYFDFDSGDLAAPFSPARYMEAIQAADKAGYPVIVVDSMSHEWAGDGGVLDMQEDELERMAGKDFRKREACKMAAWIKPKREHKAMMEKLLQVNAHVILCFRAESKVEMVRGEDGKMEIREKKTMTSIDGWIPICEKNLPFELTTSFLLMPDKPGIPRPIKLQEQHKAFFPLDKSLMEESGRRMAEWAQGSAGKPSGHTSGEQLGSGISREQAEILTKEFNAIFATTTGVDVKTVMNKWLKKQGLAKLSDIDRLDFQSVKDSALQFAREQV